MASAAELQVIPTPKPPDERPFILDEVIRRRALEVDQSPVLCLPKQGATDFEEHTALAIDGYVDAAVMRLRQLGLEPVDATLETPPAVGILAHSGLSVLVAVFGLGRLGYSSFMISTRLTGAIIGQLVDMVDCSAVIVGPEFQATALEARNGRNLNILPLLTRSDFYGVNAPKFQRVYDPKRESQKAVFVLHSSGSTGLPKPIFMSHAACIEALPFRLNMRGLICTPLFHANGLFQTFRSMYNREPLYYCNYSLPLTGQSLIEMIQHIKPDLLHAVPYIIKLLADIPGGVDALATLKLILFTGSSCPDELGDRLTEKGVHLVANYGSTETGPMMNSIRPREDKDWNYLRLLPSAKPFTWMDEIAPRLFECVALSGLKSKHRSNSDNPPDSFRTRDLFTAHPTREGLWKFVSRLDDRFNLINSEKVLPIPIEGGIRQSPLVKEAVVVGEGKTYPGLIVFKAETASHMTDPAFLEAIWPTVEAVNSNAETFSRIPRELIAVFPHDTPYPQTDKGTFIRRALYHQFEKKIERMFDEYEGGRGGSLRHEGNELVQFILDQFKEQFGIELPSGQTDCFEAGIDSLQCIQIWSLLKHKLDLNGHQSQLSRNVLYETGNAERLAKHLEQLRAGTLESRMDENDLMESLIAKYSMIEPFTSGPLETPDMSSVLLTGATGGLGAHILHQLATSAGVSTIWALVRASTGEGASARLKEALESRGLRLSPEQNAKIVVLPCDLGLDTFGISSQAMVDVLTRLTHVIHCAWAVNFNIPIRSFEAHHIKAVHNLIRLCRSVKTQDPAQFYFCSSVSAASQSPRPGSVEECPVQSPSFSQNTGYARSKYVAEHITRNAMALGIPARVLRLGQLTGDTKTGKWNIKEGIPMMIQTALDLGVLPALDEEMSWLPMDSAAATVLELTRLDSAGNLPMLGLNNPELVYNIVNPTEFHWTRDMLPLLSQSGLVFEPVSLDVWLQKLHHAEATSARLPMIKLVKWLESEYGKPHENRSDRLFYTTELTRKCSKTLDKGLRTMDVQFVKQMVDSLKMDWAAAEAAAASAA
ncbi:hypothetical protein B0I35DRAFT_349133 [Stachybotrys elegans]|uniref:Ketoreductase domain-containing protein n=1 Tax=Stachybotrys elegans TaxID=80388 RepID=A0A8K0WTE9_9HYPO|nr:hypothetical protein B0I35DRAFT_349133 [Stachybotrys elegans]